MRLPSELFALALHAVALLLSLALLPPISDAIAFKDIMNSFTPPPRRPCKHEKECEKAHKNKEIKKEITKGRIHNMLLNILKTTTGQKGTIVNVVPPVKKVPAKPQATVSTIQVVPQKYFIASSRRTGDPRKRKMLQFELCNKYKVSQYKVKKTILYVYLQKRPKYKYRYQKRHKYKYRYQKRHKYKYRYPTRVTVRVSNVTQSGVKDRLITKKRLRFTTDMWYQINMPLAMGVKMIATPNIPLVLHIRHKCFRRRGPKLIRVPPRPQNKTEDKTPFIMFQMQQKSEVLSRHKREVADAESYARYNKLHLSTSYMSNISSKVSIPQNLSSITSHLSIPKTSSSKDVVTSKNIFEPEMTTKDVYKHEMASPVRPKQNYMTSGRSSIKQDITSFYKVLNQNAKVSRKYHQNSMTSHKLSKNMTMSQILPQNAMISVNRSQNYMTLQNYILHKNNMAPLDAPKNSITSNIRPQNTMTSVHISTNSMSSSDILRRKLTSHIRPLMTNRPKREVMTAINCAPNSCCEYLYYVNLTAQSFGASVIAPDGFVQTRCRGSCAGSRPANVSADGGWRCRPVRRDPLRIAYFDDNNNLAEMVMHRYLIRGCECKARSARRQRARVLARQAAASAVAGVPTGGEASAAASASG